MIYDFGSYTEVYLHVRNSLPRGAIKQISQMNKLEKLAEPGDMVIYYGWTDGFRDCQRRLMDKGVIIVPDGKTSLLLGNKVEQLQFADTITKYPLERVYVINSEKKYKGVEVPKLNSSQKVVIKIGNSHQGRDKYLERPGYWFNSKQNIVFEQFVDNARSIRVIIIDGKHIHLVEHTNNDSVVGEKSSWIKNICPDEVSYNYENRYKLNIPHIDEIIEDAMRLRESFNNMGYVGVDYVVSEEVTGLLEVNDMIGLPEKKEIRDQAKEYWLKLCLEYLKAGEM